MMMGEIGMRKRISVIFVLVVSFLLLASAPAMARETIADRAKAFGLGLTLGYPGIGLSTNTYINEKFSIEANLIGFWNFHGGALSANFLFYPIDIIDAKPLLFTWHVGPGAQFLFWDGNRFGPYRTGSGGVGGVIQGDIGLDLLFKTAPVDLTFSLTPGVVFDAGGAGFWIGGMFASRYYF
jgi:hypothetical protein